MFYCLIGVLLLQRLYEMRLGEIHLRSLRERLLTPINELEKKRMLWLHGTWFIALLVEYLWHGEMIQAPLFLIGSLILVLCQGVRWYTIRRIGQYWVPYPVAFKGQVRLDDGLFGYLRHPNYAAVLIEFIVVPWMGGCFFVLFIWGVANTIFIRNRISLEEKALGFLENSCTI